MEAVIAYAPISTHFDAEMERDPLIMRPAISLQDFLRAVAARKQALGITDSEVEAARNKGVRRTPEKRAQLARIQKRARAAGLVPYPANF